VARLDDRLRRDLERAARPADPAGVYEELIRRKERRRIARKVRAAALAFVVISGTVAGTYGLSRVFRAGTGEQFTPAGPQNGSIVFSNRGPDGRDHLFTINPDGTGLRQLTDFRTNDTDPAVSPDGRTIAFAHELDTGQRVIASIPFTGGAVTWLTEPKLQAGRPEWSPDGSLIAFASGAGIFVMRSNGTGVREVTEGEVFNALDPTWSPDGSQVAFVGTTEPRCGEGCETGLRYDLFRVDIDGSDLVNLTNTPDRSEVYPSWSPDGNALAISVGHPDPDVQGLYLIDPFGELRGPRIVPSEYAIRGAWSPDGEFLVFQDDADPSAKQFDTQLWIVRPDGSDLRQITVEGGSEPTWQRLPEGTAGPTLEPEKPVTSPNPEAGRDIGLGFPVCNVTSVQGHFVDAQTVGTAYVATKRGDVGPCPNASEADNVVAVDVTGDGKADVSYGPIGCEVACSAFEAPDIDGDGTDELLVQDVAFSIAGLRLFQIDVTEMSDPPQIVPVEVTPPGDPAAGYEPGKPLGLWLGGDAFRLDALRCETGPDGRVLVATSAESKPYDSPDAVWYAHETTFMLRHDATIDVVGTRDFEEPATSESPSFATRGGLCGARLPSFIAGA
jgi:Tol biopolymer transport system component